MQELIDNLKDAARYLLQNGQTKQGLAVQACVTMLEDDREDEPAPLQPEEVMFIDPDNKAVVYPVSALGVGGGYVQTFCTQDANASPGGGE